jgi:hypothetical protein
MGNHDLDCHENPLVSYIFFSVKQGNYVMFKCFMLAYLCSLEYTYAFVIFVTQRLFEFGEQS